ncbi:hypothetical protein [Butyrivibrio sp. MB2005]|uniref:hypothetical protein n=1 Tax=Butyrivibrio sp. MB2005 TaxID=1280678 RepID=UPI0003F9BEA9|nr:hypothetical protein [Butyrivibrio sp. MB2005]
MFTEFDEFLLNVGYFDVLNMKKDSVEVRSPETRHHWIMKKFDKDGYPGLVLYHSHDGDKYHVHFCYKDQDIAPAVSEIMSHDRYQKKKMKLRKKITKVSNMELMRAIW